MVKTILALEMKKSRQSYCCSIQRSGRSVRFLCFFSFPLGQVDALVFALRLDSFPSQPCSPFSVQRGFVASYPASRSMQILTARVHRNKITIRFLGSLVYATKPRPNKSKSPVRICTPLAPPDVIPITYLPTHIPRVRADLIVPIHHRSQKGAQTPPRQKSRSIAYDQR